MATKADPTGAGWEIRDDVVRLRWFGGERMFSLEPGRRYVVGTAEDCEIRLEDPSQRVSRHHASIERGEDGWTMRDLDSTNGLRLDGEERKSFALAPGIEVELGAVKLIAESERSMQLIELLRRYLGWSRWSDVDEALRGVRQMANRRAALIIHGDGSLFSFARRLHVTTLGDGRPFRAHEVNETGMATLERAIGGTLYFSAEKLPDDFPLVLASVRLPDTNVRPIIGSDAPKRTARFAHLMRQVATVVIPPLSTRSDELERVLHAYAVDAASRFGIPQAPLRPHDLRWVQQGGTLKVTTHAEADDVMERLVAARTWGIAGGAARLDIHHAALSRYLRKRGIPT